MGIGFQPGLDQGKVSSQVLCLVKRDVQMFLSSSLFLIEHFINVFIEEIQKVDELFTSFFRLLVHPRLVIFSSLILEVKEILTLQSMLTEAHLQL